MTKALKLRFLSLALIVLMIMAMIPIHVGATDIPNPNYQWSTTSPSAQEVKEVYSINCDLQRAKYDKGEPSNLIGGNGGVFEDEETGSDFEVNITFSDQKEEPNEYRSISFSNANKQVLFVFVKYGGGGMMTYYPNGVTSGGPLMVPGQQAISHVSFYYCTPPTVTPGSLTITKTVNSQFVNQSINAANKAKLFTFQASFGNLGSTAITVPAGATKLDVPGDVYEFQLSDGGSVTFGNLPLGATYTVTETNNAGATSSTATKEGTIGAASTYVLETKTEEFTNTFLPGMLKVVKSWSRTAPVTSIVVELYENGTATGMTTTLSAEDDPAWTGYFYDLDLSKTYSVVEVTDVPNFTPSYSDFDGFVEGSDYMAEIGILNTYGKTVSATIEANKTVTGVGAGLTAGQFSFALYEGETLIQSATNDAEGNVTFTLTNLDVTNGSRVFTLREIAGTDADWTYDNTIFTATVNEDGEVSYSSENTPTFVNTYTRRISATIEANKTVTGVGATLTAGQFSFGLYEGETLVQSATNDASGRVTFTLTDLDMSNGSRVYTLRENEGNLDNWAYDSTPFTVTVAVDGSVTYNVQGIPTFVNTYNPPSNPPNNPPQPPPVDPPVEFTVEETETPMTPPAKIDVPEEPAPLGGADTGDSSQIVYTVLALLGFGATAGVILLRRRTAKNK